MATVSSRYSPVNGATGSDFRQDQNRLYFVEYGGKIASLNMLCDLSSTVSSGTATLHGTWLFDFDLGREAQNSEMAIADVWWDQMTSVKRQMVARKGSKIAYLGKASFASVTHVELQGYAYDSAPICGNNDASNLLTPGAMFAVLTNKGNFAKVQIISYGYDLKIQWRTYKLKSPYKVLGTGYSQPEDIICSADGIHAYVTERGGAFSKVKLSNANKAAATVIASGMNAPHQIALDESREWAYVVEYASPGKFIRIDLKTGAKTVLRSDLDHAIGLLITADQQTAYISEQSGSGGRIISVNLMSGLRTVVTTGLENPFFLSWGDSDQSSIITTERDPARRITLIDLTSSPAAVHHLATAVPNLPSSVAVVNPTTLLVCCNTLIGELSLTGFAAGDPLFLGIGHVPFDRISVDPNPDRCGYADTTVDPSYFFQVKDAPFGGTLSLMINHERARLIGAKYYRITAQSIVQKDPWTDYLWNSAAKAFIATSSKPDSKGFFAVRKATDLWYNHWLGYRLNTRPLSNGLQTVHIEFYSSSLLTSKVGDASVKIRIDNNWPRIVINNIYHYLDPVNREEVNVCGIVTKKTSNFRFNITAEDKEGHLKSWYFSALWGDNKSKKIDSGAYSPTPNKKWTGPVSQEVPAGLWDADVIGDPTSRYCAHTFELSAWDRTIDGYNHIHWGRYHKSITLMIPPLPPGV